MMFLPRRILALVFVAALSAAAPIRAQDAVSLMTPDKPSMGWTFDNGSEFPGAKGGIETDDAEKHNGQASLKLTGDFTGGGNYVQAAKAIDGVDIREVSFWVKNLMADHLTLRLIDATGRCHQFNLVTTPSADWQRIVFPVEQHFANQAKANALTIVKKYEAWGGDKSTPDGKWTGPAKLMVILIGKRSDNPVNTIWLNSVSLIPKSATAAAASKGVPSSVALDEIIEGEHFWDFTLGTEFPGAKGSLQATKDDSVPAGYILRMTGDFSGGGAYVAAIKKLDDAGLSEFTGIRFKVRSSAPTSVGIRMGDETDQTHQKKGVPIPGDGKWHEISIKVSDVVGGEHWGGANDAKWHGAAKYVSIGLGKPEGDNKAISIDLSEVKAEGLAAAVAGGTVFESGFEESGLAGWTPVGAVAQDAVDPFKGSKSLVLEKTEATLRDEVSIKGPSFNVSPGAIEVSFAAKSDLTSMDNSYQGSLSVEFAGGRSEELATLFRKNPWKSQKKTIQVPDGATSARIVARINKETPGEFWVDDIVVTSIVGSNKDERIKRLMFQTAQVGNLLFPQDSREVKIQVWTSKPLPEDQRTVSVTVRDYWGAEQAEALVAIIERKGRQGQNFEYEGKIDLAGVPLEIGRYYELHASIARKDAEPFTNYTSLAILPEAPANAYDPLDVPFTSRNWDNRLADYVELTHRLGIRICGVWGKMEADPAKVEAPRLDRIMELKMGYLTGSSAHAVEQRSEGWRENYNEENLRKGVRNYFEKYGKNRPVIVNLGNEPHAKGEDVKVDVEAYRIVYTEIKKIDPSILVVGTSVGIQEEYFKYGFGQWLDAYDFHVYEDALSVRKIVSEKYPEMFKKYGHKKPVWSTELGLNSQGMARQFVAGEVYRKFANFFAGGGANVSWFGLLYPDSDGSAADSFGSAHNVFDCRYNRYAPKLDAIAYFNAVNGIAIKKYVADKTYGNNTHAFLFRDKDSKALQIWYNDKGRKDVFVPLAGVGEVELIRIDGRRSTVDAGGKGITLTIAEDPILLLYSGGPDSLPEAPGAPAISLAATSDMLVRGEKTGFDVALGDVSPANVQLKAPPQWSVESAPATGADGKPVVRYSLSGPESSAVREADMIVVLNGLNGKPSGELYYRPAVTGTLTAEILPLAVENGKEPSVKLVIRNNSPAKQEASWDVSITGEQGLKEGVFSGVESTQTHFVNAASGAVELDGKSTKEIVLPIAGADLYKVYRMRSVVRDNSGRVTVQERPVSAFYGVPRAAGAIVPDGKLDEAAWKNAPVRKLDNIDQFYAFEVKEKAKQDWTGVDDLSAEIRYLWDDANLYLSIAVRDDKPAPKTQDSGLWQQDGLQFLIDPMRRSDRKIGKYDYVLGVGTKGPQAWCVLSADGAAPSGDATDMKVGTAPGRPGSSDLTYEIAIPWRRLGPFKPAPGGNLGFTLIVNEGDDSMRNAFMTWFGNAHSKDIDTVGDLILVK